MKSLQNFIVEKYLIDKDTKYETPKTDDPSTWQKGDILVGTMCYSMTLVKFFKIIRRTSKKFDVVQLKDKIVSGNGMQGECIATDEETHDKFSGRVNKFNRLTINGYRCYLWDGKPEFFTHLD